MDVESELGRGAVTMILRLASDITIPESPRREGPIDSRD